MNEIPRGPWNSLLVDDDEEDYLITLDALERAPGTPTGLEWADNYQTGMEKLLAGGYDVVMVDYDLGAKSGVEFIQEARQKGALAPLILFTGRANFETEIEAMEAGATLYLVKTEATPRLLKRTLRYAIDRGRLQRQLDLRSQALRDTLESIEDGFFSINREWRITYTNHQATENTGIPREKLVGAILWEAFPQLIGTIVEYHYRQCMQARLPVNFEAPSLVDERWYSISVYPAEDGISIYWQDISARKRRERMTATISELNEDFARPGTAAEIMETVGSKMIAHFGLDRLWFAYVDEPAGRINTVYDRRAPAPSGIENMPGGMDSLPNVLRLFDLIGPDFLGSLKAGQVLAMSDIAGDPRTGRMVEAHRAIGTGARLLAPYVRDGELCFLVNLHKSQPHDWQAEEIELLEQLAPRLYLTLERAQDDERLRDSEAKYRQLAELSPNAILVNVRGRYAYANPAAARLMVAADPNASTPQDLVGRSPFEFLEPEYHDLVRQRVRHVLEQKSPTASVRYPWKRLDGTTVEVEVVAGLIPWEGEQGVLVIAHDIGESKRAEAALRESERRFRSMADGTPLMIWVTDAGGEMEFFNQAYAQFFDVTLEQVQAEGWQPRMHPGSVDYVTEYFACLETHRPFAAVGQVRRGDGAWRWMASYGQPRFAEGGDFIGMAGSSIDITEQQAALQKLAVYAGQLQRSHAALQRFAELASADLGAAQRMLDGRSEGPAAPGSSQAAPGDGQAAPGDGQANEIGAMLERMQKRIDGLLALARIPAAEDDRQPLDLTAAAQAAAAGLAGLVERSGGRVEIDALPAVPANSAQMLRLFDELIRNALLFHLPGEAPRVHVRGDADGDCALIEVSDNGLGFEPGQAERIFEPFVRLAAGSAQPGIGMGLVICKQIVEQHGGSIGARSYPGEGTTVVVKLPV